MTQDTPIIKDDLKLFKFSTEVLQKPNAKTNLLEFLTEVLNNGYNVPRFKYNVIQTTRIKNPGVFVEDLGFLKPGSFLMVLVYTGKKVLTRKDLEQISDDNIDVVDVTDDDFTLADYTIGQIIGTLGLKPYKDNAGELGYEITAFTSFTTGAGKLLIKKAEKISTQLNSPYLMAVVICEHDMVPYYNKHGFFEVAERLLLEVDETGRVKGTSIEDGVYASQNFHMAFMKKKLR